MENKGYIEWLSIYLALGVYLVIEIGTYVKFFYDTVVSSFSYTCIVYILYARNSVRDKKVVEHFCLQIPQSSEEETYF